MSVVARPQDPHAVADALARLLDDPEQREAKGKAARVRAEVEFSYDLLWGERVLRSVANVTPRDIAEFLDLAGALRLRADTERLSPALERAAHAAFGEWLDALAPARS